VSPRRRLGVALMLDPPWSIEVQGLRRALGDTSLVSVAPHLTLVPPVNVRTGELTAALDVVRKAAAREDGPFSLELGPVATFMPTNPVLYLAVEGAGMASLRRLREAVVAGPLSRPDRWPWVPHVTVADQAPPEQTEAALVSLRHYRSDLPFDRVVVMEERDRQWRPLSDACLGPPVVVGRGGLELEITAGRIVGPDALEAIGGGGAPEFAALVSGRQAPGGSEDEAPHRGATPAASTRQAPAPAPAPAPGRAPDPSVAAPADEKFDDDLPPCHPLATIVLTGRRQGHVVGVAIAWQAGQVGARVQVGVFVEAASRAQGVGRALLIALEASARNRGWETEGVEGYGPAGFFEASSPWIRDVHPPEELGAVRPPP
jgi:2'-5' RNA ligase/GNAT superfamily N-acetyltransferase